jgi:UMF1 family MFS transporter
VTFADALGLGTGLAVRLSMLSAAIWWAAFTIIPYRGIRNREPVAVEREPGGLVRQSFGQLGATLKDMRNYPATLTFLVAYLFYNDGIQTVIVSASVYGEKQLGFSESVLIGTILLVQFVAFGGALLFGRLATMIGTHKVILGGLTVWMMVVVVAYFIPEKNVPLFLAMAIGIGLVLGGTQALSRSFFSQLIPRGREAEYFSLYQAGERGTSWLGTLVFGLVHQITHSYRPAIFALIIFFVVGIVLLARVDPRKGIAEAGNVVPQVV